MIDLNNSQLNSLDLWRFAYNDSATEQQQKPRAAPRSTMSRKNRAPPPPPRQWSSHDNSLSSSSHGPSQISNGLRKTQVANVPLEPGANGVKPSRLANTYTTSASKANIVHVDLTNDCPELTTSRKRVLDETDIGDEIHVLTAPTAKKRLRSVAAPTTMGAKVSQLVHAYESKAQDASNAGLQQSLSASSSRGILPLPYNSSSASYGRDGVRQFTISPPARSVADASTSKKKTKTTLGQKKSLGPSPRSKGGSRYFECERCTIATPYNFEAHVMEELRCANCNHVCCRDCVIKSIGEKCEDAEWHSTEGYWQWRMEREKRLHGSLVI